ncbi:MAG: 3'-5' exonuclease, partial [Planctomycetota bacterium]
EQFDSGDLQGISDYCRCDVLDTYFVFLRSMVLQGKITLEQELEIVAETKDWIEKRSDEFAAYERYLSCWEDWHDPWVTETADVES